MKKLKTLFFALLLTSTLIAQSNDPVVLTIDNNEYHVSEFNYIYTKNNPNASFKKKDLNAYMELFIDYKLKVIEAKKMGYDTIPELKRELNKYRNQLGQPYMIDQEKNEALIKEAYNRTLNEVRASHILIKLAPDAEPKDTLEAYNRIMELRKRIVEGGEDFKTVAQGKGGSEDPSVKDNGGDLGYFTALQMVYPFEEAAYTTKVGDVSMPVRTNYGYHLVYVQDKRKAKGIISTNHIMIVSRENMTQKQKDEAKTKIFEIYDLLQKGEDFGNLAKKYSEDPTSKSKGGMLPPFGAGSRQRMVFEFEEQAFKLENDGDYSEPFQTIYGWHIVKRTHLEPVKSYNDIYKELKSKVERDQRAIQTQQAFINKLKVEYDFTENKELLSQFTQKLDSKIFSGKWNVGDNITGMDEVLFSFKDNKATLGEFVNFLLLTQRRVKPQAIPEFIDGRYNEFVNEKIKAYENTQLETKYPEFRTLIQEYQDGILIFEIMQNEIWKKASDDTTGLKNYYNIHQADFMYPTRYKGTLYACQDEATATEVTKMLQTEGVTKDEIVKKLNANSTLKVSQRTNTFNSQNTAEFKFGKNDEIRIFTEGVNEVFEHNETFYVFDVENVLEPEQRPFSEAKGLVTAAYQNQIQEEWLTRLRKEHAIVVNEKVLKKAKKYRAK